MIFLPKRFLNQISCVCPLIFGFSDDSPYFCHPFKQDGEVDEWLKSVVC